MKKLEDVINKSKIKYNENMKKYTTMNVGGNADIVVFPTSTEDVINVITYAKDMNIEYHILGNGSNVMISDLGIEGIVVILKQNFRNIKIDGNYISALAGDAMPYVSYIAKNNGLSGLEFACGIPGSVGGSTKMNAGAYDSEMKNVIDKVIYLDEDGTIKEKNNDELEFSYRHSYFTNNKCVVLEVKFKLNNGNIQDIQNKMDENNLSRRTKQPLEYHSAGSVFRRPVGYFVGKLIQDSNLKGVNVGGAYVSEKHTGFIVNKNNATCNDILNLIKLIQETVYDKFKVELKTEIEFIGRID